MWESNLAELVKEFKAKDIPDSERPKADTLEEAIRIAALSVDRNGRRHSHQWCIPGAVLQAVCNALLDRVAEIHGASSFAEIFSIVTSETRRIHGAGELVTYDVALRIGIFLNQWPQAVYLHAGPRKAARRRNVKGNIVAMEQFPQTITSQLTASQIETFLCELDNMDRHPSKPLRSMSGCV